MDERRTDDVGNTNPGDRPDDAVNDMAREPRTDKPGDGPDHVTNERESPSSPTSSGSLRSEALMEELTSILRTVLPDLDGTPEADDSIVDQGLDSVAMVELLTALEERFRISVPPRDIAPENFQSLRSLAALVERLRSAC